MCKWTGRAPFSWEGTHVCLCCCLGVESGFQGKCSPPEGPGRLWLPAAAVAPVLHPENLTLHYRVHLSHQLLCK